MGANGRGTGEHFGVQDEIDLYFGTFAKAFAAIGGVTAGEKRRGGVDPLQRAHQCLCQGAAPGLREDRGEGALASWRTSRSCRERMWSIARRLQTGLVDLGFDIGDTESPITPVYVDRRRREDGHGDDRRCCGRSYGVFVSGVTYPVVPRGVILFRMIPTAAHTEEDVDRTVAAFRAMRDGMKLDLSTKPSQQNR